MLILKNGEDDENEKIDADDEQFELQERWTARRALE